jgi:tetratricopeptide (TPR) repeat protein
MAQTGRGEEAAKLGAAAVAASPEDPVLLVGQAKVLGILGRRDEAVKLLDRRLALGPDAEALTMRAELGTSLPLADRLKDLEKANRLAPRYSTAWVIRGLVLARADKPREALAATDEALAHFPDDRLALGLRAELRERAGDKAGALADLGRLIELEPKSAQRWNERCWFRLNNGGPPEQALPDCNRALELDPRSAAALDSRGLAHLQMGKLKEALADYEAALAAEPEMAASLWGRGVTRRKLGDTKGGDADLAKARAIAPTIDTYMAKSGVKP